MSDKHELTKLEAGRYEYRGVKIFKYDSQGFSYKYSTRTDTYFRTDATYPVALKDITAKIDQDIDVNGKVVDHAGYMIKDTRTQVGA
jgi:hypothetical protein